MRGIYDGIKETAESGGKLEKPGRVNVTWITKLLAVKIRKDLKMF